MNAAILTIGDELLGGFVHDTNSVWLAQELRKSGVAVRGKMTVGDTRTEIVAALGRWDGEVDLVVVTGGLGPTHDDVTKLACCDYFRSELIFDEEYWETLVARFTSRGYEIPENNRTQAEIPDKCEILPNPAGSALGMKFLTSQTTFVVLPGVPEEMRAIAIQSLLPTLDADPIAVRTLHTIGSYESALAKRLAKIVAQPEGVRIAFLPDLGSVDIRVEALSAGDQGAGRVNSVVKQIEQELGDLIYGYDEETLPAVIGRELGTRGQTVAVAESCSGGLVASMLTDVPGSSATFLGGVVAYSDKVKAEQLGVSEDALAEQGAVSEKVAGDMAQGVRRLLHADWGLATTGIAGPGGGSAEKPVGLVYLAVAGRSRTIVRAANLVSDDRRRHKKASTLAVLDLLRRELTVHG